MQKILTELKTDVQKEDKKHPLIKDIDSFVKSLSGGDSTKLMKASDQFFKGLSAAKAKAKADKSDLMKKLEKAEKVVRKETDDELAPVRISFK
ncbi:MAG: hypothetical protein AAGC57_07695 [Pseudomonadota bacterium]